MAEGFWSVARELTGLSSTRLKKWQEAKKQQKSWEELRFLKGSRSQLLEEFQTAAQDNKLQFPWGHDTKIKGPNIFVSTLFLSELNEETFRILVTTDWVWAAMENVWDKKRSWDSLVEAEGIGEAEMR